MVQLADQKKVNDVAVEIVQHFAARRLFSEEDLGAAGKRLNIGRMLRENLNDLSRNPIFAADVGEWAAHVGGYDNQSGPTAPVQTLQRKSTR